MSEFECRYFWNDSFLNEVARQIAAKLAQDIKEREEWEAKVYQDHLDNINQPKHFNGFIKLINNTHDNGKA